MIINIFGFYVICGIEKYFNILLFENIYGIDCIYHLFIGSNFILPFDSIFFTIAFIYDTIGLLSVDHTRYAEKRHIVIMLGR